MENVTDEEFKKMRVLATARGMTRVYNACLEKSANQKGGWLSALGDASKGGVELLKFLTQGTAGMAINAGLVGGGALGVGASIIGQQNKSLSEEERRARRRIAYYQKLTDRLASQMSGAR